MTPRRAVREPPADPSLSQASSSRHGAVSKLVPLVGNGLLTARIVADLTHSFPSILQNTDTDIPRTFAECPCRASSTDVLLSQLPSASASSSRRRCGRLRPPSSASEPTSRRLYKASRRLLTTSSTPALEVPVNRTRRRAKSRRSQSVTATVSQRSRLTTRRTNSPTPSSACPITTRSGRSSTMAMLRLRRTRRELRDSTRQRSRR